MMKFELKAQHSENEEEELASNPDPDSSDPDYTPHMNADVKKSAIAPKRTINESGAIVVTPGTDGDLVETSLAEDVINEGPSRKRRANPVSRAKRFRTEWLSFDMFKGWLKAHPNKERAMCAACNIVLNAGKSELEKHATSIKHQRRMADYRQEQSVRFNSYGESQEVILVDTDEHEDKVNSTFLQRHDHHDASSYSQEPFETVTLDLGQVHHVPMQRKPVEHPHYTSKAVVTKPAPPWKATAIVNGHVTRLELSDYRGRYLILFFYPQDFSAVCPTELLNLSDRVLEFRALQTEIVACSVDSHLTHLAWARTPRSDGGLGNPKIPLLADPTHHIARDYGVLLPDLGHSLRAHFIIDRRGIIRHMLVNDLGVGRSIDELLRTTQALQHVDERETGCPADWKPGMPSV